MKTCHSDGCSAIFTLDGMLKNRAEHTWAFSECCSAILSGNGKLCVGGASCGPSMCVGGASCGPSMCVGGASCGPSMCVSVCEGPHVGHPCVCWWGDGRSCGSSMCVGGASCRSSMCVCVLEGGVHVGHPCVCVLGGVFM